MSCDFDEECYEDVDDFDLAALIEEQLMSQIEPMNEMVLI